MKNDLASVLHCELVFEQRGRRRKRKKERTERERKKRESGTLTSKYTKSKTKEARGIQNRSISIDKRYQSGSSQDE
jgi:hypothetical protein